MSLTEHTTPPQPYHVEQVAQTLQHQTLEVDVCVVGGGMAGLIAAVSAARLGSSVALVHDRPVLGGNASSEIRMWICGAHGRNNKETGLLEEIQLDNLHRNPTLNFSIWDSILYGKAAFTPGLKLLLNTTCTGATMAGERIESIRVWGLTTQTIHTIRAKQFIDCSGDSVLAPLTGALVRVGRESREEFDEDIEPTLADERTMGNSLLIQLRECDSPQQFTPPTWAYKFRSPDDLPNRHVTARGNNFWWLELGGLSDTLRDADAIRDELMKTTYGVLDYIKNYHPSKDEYAHFGLEWMGSLPGKRENRRYVGDHILTQNDIRAGGTFADIVAYGGWSMDDHHPAGLLYPGKPTVFHPAPTPYGIPFRSMYSKNVPNLLCAGRNLSATHAAMSSTRVMGTTSVMGQAVGTAAALCVRHSCDARSLHDHHLAELQRVLMDNDHWLPGLKRDVSPLTRSAKLEGAGNLKPLCDGHDRNIGDVDHCWRGNPGDAVTFRFDRPTHIGGLRLVFDSNLNDHKRMPCYIPLKGIHASAPDCLVRRFHVDVQSTDGSWTTAFTERDNFQRLVRVPIDQTGVAIRLVPDATWGAPQVTIFSVDILEEVPKLPPVPEGEPWPDVVGKVPASDLAPPENNGEEDRGRSRAGA